MTLGQLLLWIIIAIIAYFLFKLGLAILIIVIILLVIYYVINLFTKKNRYERFAVINNRPADNTVTDYNQLPTDGYIGIDNYYRSAPVINSYPIEACQMLRGPGVISEYCVDRQLANHGNLAQAVKSCELPGKQSARYG